jgi:hypothetical protein
MWLSSVKNDAGEQETVLQYGQQSWFEFMQRLECLDCEGVTSTNEMGCMTTCAGMDDYVWQNVNLKTGEPLTQEEYDLAWVGEEGRVAGQTANEIDGFQHGHCYSCTASTSAEKGLAQGTSCADQPLILWPHNQVNTLRKVRVATII